jgi:hypothetical protein
MNEFSFIKFTDTIPSNDCDLALPIRFSSDLAFFADPLKDGDPLITIDIVSKEGVFIKLLSNTIDSGFVKIGDTTISDLNCFRLRAVYDGADSTYSNLLRYDATSATVLLKYLCYEPQFGFDYSIDNSYNQVRLPIRLFAPQFPQDDKIYVDGNGVRRLLVSKIDKEFELETEYMPENWHEKTVVMLAHDRVGLNDIQLQKSAPYEIDYENEDVLSCGITLNKASAKLSKNTTIRNNNC